MINGKFSKPEVLFPIIISFCSLIVSGIGTCISYHASRPDVKILNNPNTIDVSIVACKTPLSAQSSPDYLVTASADLTVSIVNNGTKHATIQHVNITGLNSEWFYELAANNQLVSIPYQLKSGESHTLRYRIKSQHNVTSVERAIAEATRFTDALGYNSSYNKNIE